MPLRCKHREPDTLCLAKRVIRFAEIAPRFCMVNNFTRIEMLVANRQTRRVCGI